MYKQIQHKFSPVKKKDLFSIGEVKVFNVFNSETLDSALSFKQHIINKTFNRSAEGHLR